MTLEEDRVFDNRTEAVEVLVATGAGLVRVAASGDRVGRFDMACRCEARDVAAAGDDVVVATAEDVLDADYEPTGFGPAVAVGFADGAPVAAGEDGRLARRVAGEWEPLGAVDEVRDVDGSLVAAADGVHRLRDGVLEYAGLEDVRAVAGHGVPLAAAADGLYRLGNGWMDELDGGFHAVDAATDGRAHAAGESGVHARWSPSGEWVEAPLPVAERVVGFGHGPGTNVAVTDAGTVLLDDGRGDGWRQRPLGLSVVGGVAVRNPPARR